MRQRGSGWETHHLPRFYQAVCVEEMEKVMKLAFGAQVVGRAAVSSPKGAIAAARKQSAIAAAEMLDRGGSAVDAAVAAAAVAGVIEPMETTLAGSGFMVVGEPGKTPVAIEFGPVAPLAAHEGLYELDTARTFDRGLGVSVVVGDANISGPKAWGVPGVIAGLAEAHSRFGRLPWSDLLQPAIRLCHDGFPADSYFVLEALAKLDHLRRDKAAAATYLVNGLPPVVPHLGNATLGAEHLVKQPKLGQMLERVAKHGAKDFYHGETANLLVESAKEYGGLLSLKDLQNYRARVEQARHIKFRDVDVWGPRAPCAVLTQFQMLAAWQQLYPKAPASMESAEVVKNLADICWHAFADRYHWLGDPEFAQIPEAELLSDAHIVAEIRSGKDVPRSLPSDPPPWEVFAQRAAHDPWAFSKDGKAGKRWAPEGATESLGGTTHVSLADADGMAVALTYTAADHFGSKVVCPRTGLLMDAAMGWFNARPNSPNSIAPGKRPLTNMAPLLLTKESKPIAAIGGPGGRRIVHAVMQLVLSLVDQKLAASEAAAAPRIDASGSVLLLSERLAVAAEALASEGIPVRLVNEQHEPFGYELARPVIVAKTKEGGWMPSVDPFTKGSAVVLK
jgi:gamma-glutamyltranspeptidase / glutathione hydrolase